MAINPDIASDIGEHGEFTSDSSSGAEIFWNGAGDDLPAFSLPCPGRYERSNGEVYFNADGLAGSWVLESNNVTSDHHSGWDYIEDGQTVIVDERKQMRVNGVLTIEGCLQVEGILVLD